MKVLEFTGGETKHIVTAARPRLIGLDVDDVLANLLYAWLERINKDRGTSWIPVNLTKWECWTDLGLTREEFFSYLDPTIYYEVEPFRGAVEFVNNLRDMGHRIRYVTNCGPNNESAPLKMEWLKHHEFLRSEDKFIPTTNKQIAPVDVLLDDHVGNLQGFQGYAMLFTQPHNRLVEWHGKRVKSYWEAELSLKY